MFGHHSGSAFADVPPAGSPWDGGARDSDLARDAGLNDIGRGVAPAAISAPDCSATPMMAISAVLRMQAATSAGDIGGTTVCA